VVKATFGKIEGFPTADRNLYLSFWLPVGCGLRKGKISRERSLVILLNIGVNLRRRGPHTKSLPSNSFRGLPSLESYGRQILDISSPVAFCPTPAPVRPVWWTWHGARLR
jgi:hypothetical protein